VKEARGLFCQKRKKKSHCGGVLEGAYTRRLNANRAWAEGGQKDLCFAPAEEMSMPQTYTLTRQKGADWGGRERAEGVGGNF